MKLIDADIFESVLDFADADVCEESPDGHCDFGFSRENIRELLQDIPAIDAVPVVRCRECKHLGFCGDATNLEVMGFYGYCSRGERKEGADSDT